MARIRTIKPEFFTSETMGKCSLRARLLFIGLWTQCDDEGRMIDNARILVGQLFPLDDDVDAKAVEADLRELASMKLIVRYEVEGRNYLAVSSFDEHQRVNRPTPSKLPAPPSDGGFTDPSGIDSDDSRSTHGALSEDSPPERKGKEGKGDARSEPLAAVLPLPGTNENEANKDPADFVQFYEAYPRHKDRQGALKAWKRLRAGERQLALDTVGAFARAMRGKDPEFIPYPAKWLNNRRWEDQQGKPAADGRAYDPDTGAWLSASAVERMG